MIILFQKFHLRYYIIPFKDRYLWALICQVRLHQVGSVWWRTHRSILWSNLYVMVNFPYDPTITKHFTSQYKSSQRRANILKDLAPDGNLDGKKRGQHKEFTFMEEVRITEYASKDRVSLQYFKRTGEYTDLKRSTVWGWNMLYSKEFNLRLRKRYLSGGEIVELPEKHGGR